MLRKFTVILLTTCLVYSCSLTEKEKTTGLFPAKHISHFPEGDKSKEVISTLFYPELENHINEGVYIRKTYRYSKKKMTQVVQSLKERNAAVVKHSDPCNLYLEFYYNKGLNRDASCADVLPVPAFWEEKVFLGLQESKYLPDDFNLYVLSSEPGVFIGEKHRNNKEDLFGTPTWRNGITKGVAISEERQVCIYWTEIW